MELNPLLRYTDAAGRSAGVVLSAYSTSFGLACRLLGPEGRRDIANIYALVRVADEAVDGAAAAAGLDDAAVTALARICSQDRNLCQRCSEHEHEQEKEQE